MRKGVREIFLIVPPQFPALDSEFYFSKACGESLETVWFLAAWFLPRPKEIRAGRCLCRVLVLGTKQLWPREVQ